MLAAVASSSPGSSNPWRFEVRMGLTDLAIPNSSPRQAISSVS